MVRTKNDEEFIREYDINDHKVMDMEEQKRERVIEAALTEFAKGYTPANLDAIANEAGISKGLLFHYFGSKRALFLFLIKYCGAFMEQKYSEVLLRTRDVLENLHAVSMVAIEISFKNPLILRFMAKAIHSLGEVFPEGMPKDIPNSNQELLIKILTASDQSMFREDIDRDKAQNIILWTMRGFSESLLRFGTDLDNYTEHYDSIMKEFDEYTALLRRLLYKQ